MSPWNLEYVLELLNESAKIALYYFDHPKREFKKDRSIVTQADKEIEAMLAKEFDRPNKGSYLIGEETVESKDEAYLAVALEGSTWIIDPIDGTSSYANKLPSWGISIAHAESGRITDGAIYLPLVGKLILTRGKEVYTSAWNRDCREGIPELTPFSPRHPIPPFEGGVIALDQDSTRRGHTLPGTVHASGSCIFALLHLFMGGYISYIAYSKLWDVASGVALMDALGFLGRFENGEPFTTSLDSNNYELSPATGNKRWKTKGRVIFCGSEEALTYTLQGLKKNT
ncbi:MAG: inositol monophosphatase family protein [Spirochaetales bacterium]